MRHVTISVEKNKLTINTDGDKKAVKFKYAIGKIQKFDNCIVVMVDPPFRMVLNENIFGVSYDGKILWQIEVISHVHENSPYTWIGRKDSLLEAYNWDGTLYTVNPSNGKMISEKFIK